MFFLDRIYAELLPVSRSETADLGAGLTPLIKADRLAEELGLTDLWIKNDSLNPTNSFKDRPVTVALSKAVEFGFKTVACALVATGLDARRVPRQPIGKARRSAYTHRNMNRLFAHAHHHHHPLRVG